MVRHNTKYKGRKKCKKNKEKNLKKKKKAKMKSNSSDQEIFRSKRMRENERKTAQSLKTLCHEFRKLNHTASTRDIVQAKQRRDRRVMDKELKDLCKNMKSMCNKESIVSDEEECFAKVESLAQNVSDLIISNDNFEPGFRFTRWQQRKFHQNVRRRKIKYNNDGDEKDMENSVIPENCDCKQ